MGNGNLKQGGHQLAAIIGAVALVVAAGAYVWHTMQQDRLQAQQQAQALALFQSITAEKARMAAGREQLKAQWEAEDRKAEAESAALKAKNDKEAAGMAEQRLEQERRDAAASVAKAVEDKAKQHQDLADFVADIKKEAAAGDKAAFATMH